MKTIKNLKWKWCLSPLICLLSIGQPSRALAQGPNFSGTWELIRDTVLSGQKSPSSVIEKQITVTQLDGRISMQKTSVDTDGKELTVTETVSINRSTDTLTLSKRRKVVSVYWSGNHQSLIEKKVYYQITDPSAIDYTVIDTWDYSSDGKTLTIFRKVVVKDAPASDWTEEAFFQKV